MNAVETTKLTKQFKTKTAVNGIDLSVNDGELFALLGVNGAGKTTTIRMLSCLSAPTSGDALIYGMSVKNDKSGIKRIIGISPQDTAVAGNLTVRENIEFMAKICGYDAGGIKSRSDEMTEMFGLSEILPQRAKTLSGGQQRKLSIAMALIGEPKLLFLDEPTLGLDVLARRELWRAVEKLKGKMTIILTTHYMEEAEELSDRIAIMINGNIEALGTLSEIENEAGATGLENAFVAIAERSVK